MIGLTRDVCRSAGQAPKPSKQHVKTLQADLEEPEEDVATLYQIRSQPGQLLQVEVALDGNPRGWS